MRVYIRIISLLLLIVFSGGLLFFSSGCLSPEKSSTKAESRARAAESRARAAESRARAEKSAAEIRRKAAAAVAIAAASVETSAPVLVTNFTTVRVFYATDRNPVWTPELPKLQYGSLRDESLHYGCCDISIPKDHRIGNLEAPEWFLLQQENPAKHIVVLRITPFSQAQYFTRIRHCVCESKEQKALIFVHGFNNDFEDAAKRTAQMAYDLKFSGAPVFYSWPSGGSLLSYMADEATAIWAVDHLTTFLEDFAEKSDAKEIYVIAHSMGSRVVTGALLKLLGERPDLRDRYREIVYAAADIDVQVFKQNLPCLKSGGFGVTVYCSSTDAALSQSRLLHHMALLGDCRYGVFVFPGVDSIDATDGNTELLGHAYIADGPSVLADLYSLIHFGRSAEHRITLDRVPSINGVYWKLTRREIVVGN